MQLWLVIIVDFNKNEEKNVFISFVSGGIQQ
jgi:hypothetical protein